MATRTIKARVEIDGEKQYKQALAELNSGNKVLASEMRKLQAEYKGNADSVEFLNKKGDTIAIDIDELPIPKPIVNGSGFQPTIDGWQGIEINVEM